MTELRSALFTCANDNQVGNALPVAEKLTERGIRCRVIVLDPVYHQAAGEVLERSPLASRVEHATAPRRSLAQPFAKLSMLERFAAVRTVTGELLEMAGDHGALVLGMDGAFERVILRRYRKRRRFTSILWDGLIARRPALVAPGADELAWRARRWLHFTGRRAVLRAAGIVGFDPYVPGLAGNSSVDCIYTMGRFVTDAFRSQGVGAAIETTGIPRFAGLGRARSGRAFRPRDALYLTGSFLWHDEPLLHECQQRDLDDLAACMPAIGWSLRVRLHPREDPRHYDRLCGVQGVVLSRAGDMPLWDDLAGADVVVTAMSTAALEALGLGRPIAVYMGAFPPALVETTLGVHPRVPVARSCRELVNVLGAIGGQQDPAALHSVLDDFISPTTDSSSSLIADSIAAHLDARARLG